MPHSVHEQGEPEPVVPGQGLAVTAEALYIVNLLLLPGLAFIGLLFVYIKNIHTAPALAACHQIRQCVTLGSKLTQPRPHELESHGSGNQPLELA